MKGTPYLNNNFGCLLIRTMDFETVWISDSRSNFEDLVPNNRLGFVLHYDWALYDINQTIPDQKTSASNVNRLF
jgi:hypothetical protein